MWANAHAEDTTGVHALPPGDRSRILLQAHLFSRGRRRRRALERSHLDGVHGSSSKFAAMAGGVGKEDLDLLLRGAKAAPTHTMMTTTGWLGKKGGGEAADAGSLKNMIRKKVEPWNARFFVLPAGGRTIRWYDSAEDAEAGMTEKGSMDIPVGQTRFVLKEVDRARRRTKEDPNRRRRGK